MLFECVLSDVVLDFITILYWYVECMVTLGFMQSARLACCCVLLWLLGTGNYDSFRFDSSLKGTQLTITTL